MQKWWGVGPDCRPRGGAGHAAGAPIDRQHEMTLLAVSWMCRHTARLSMSSSPPAWSAASKRATDSAAPPPSAKASPPAACELAAWRRAALRSLKRTSTWGQQRRRSGPGMSVGIFERFGFVRSFGYTDSRCLSRSQGLCVDTFSRGAMEICLRLQCLKTAKDAARFPGS